MATLAPGQTFAGYSVEAVVGRGGMGVVYRATDLALERSVALKLVAPELAADPRFRERFLRESRLAASLEHRACACRCTRRGRRTGPSISPCASSRGRI